MKHSKTYEMLVNELGRPTFNISVNNIPSHLLSALPKLLIECWENYGFCQFQEGFYSIINPEEWQEVVDAWLQGTPYTQLGNWYALARNAFGSLYIYNPNTATKLTIDSILGVISGSISVYEDEFDINYSIHTFYGSISEEYEDFIINDKPIFKKTLKKLGPLGWYEMYAFEPAFALLGDAALTMDNLVKVDARVHMMLLRDMIEQPKIWSFNIEEDLKRAGTSLAEVAERGRLLYKKNKPS